MGCLVLCSPSLLSSPNQRQWNKLIKQQALSGNMEQAISMYVKMLEAGINGDNFTFPIVLKAAACLSSASTGASIHGHIIKTCFSIHTFVQTALINMYSTLGHVEHARLVFEKMSQKDLISWNSMLDAYASRGQMDDAVKLFDTMPVRDKVSFNIMVFGLLNNGREDLAGQMFDGIPVKDVVSWNSMISAYAKVGKIDAARGLFERMPERNVVSWNAIIAGHVQSHCYIEAIDLFYDMKAHVVKPNHLTLVSVLSACAHMGSLAIGRNMHIHAMETGLASDRCVVTALIDMYAKCGSIENALEVFYKSQEKDVFCWNSMISGLAIHGHGQASIKLFHDMRSQGVKPDDITFIGLLSACSHSGLVEAGRRIFAYMDEHGISPKSEHYGCMVDLMGRAGLLDNANEIIESMPFEPGASILGALLSACVVHRNVEMGQIIAERAAARADCMSDGEYMMLANMYATCGRWEDASRWRAVMNDAGISKTAGCSMIEVNGRLHRFLAGDNECGLR